MISGITRKTVLEKSVLLKKPMRHLNSSSESKREADRNGSLTSNVRQLEQNLFNCSGSKGASMKSLQRWLRSYLCKMSPIRYIFQLAISKVFAHKF